MPVLLINCCLIFWRRLEKAVVHCHCFDRVEIECSYYAYVQACDRLNQLQSRLNSER